MKKIQLVGRAAQLSLAIAVATAPLSLVGCSGSDNQGSNDEPSESQTVEEQPVEETQSDYAVTIDGSTLTSDYEGSPAIIVDFTFTNNSDKATSFAVACSPKAFQNGVQLETAIVTDDLGNGYMAEIKPGATTTARLAYSLTDQSDVTVEVSELISFDDALLAEATFPAA